MEGSGSQTTGLYVGFDGFRSPSEADLIRAVRHSLVVLDTNVLLNLYNYQGPTLDDFIEVFEAFGDRLFIPHQVLDEFWRNRRSVLAENQGRHRELEKVQAAFEDAEKAFRTWYQRVVDRLSPPPAETTRYFEQAKTGILDYMAAKNADAAAIRPDTPTYEDGILKRLEPMLRGRVGRPPNATELKDLRQRGRQRVAEKVPPGYMDGEKNPERAVGDFILWVQAMEASKERHLDVLLVTQDQKEDWWADRGTASQRARPELVAELRAYSSHTLLMVRAHDLVRLAPHIGVQVSEATVADAESTTDAVDGWTVEAASAYLGLLGSSWPEHRAIFEEAIRAGGEISRKRMAKHLRRNANDSMHGVGKPYVTAVRRLVERGVLGDEATAIPLTASYETGGWMSSFAMPENLVAVFRVALIAGDTKVDGGEQET